MKKLLLSIIAVVAVVFSGSAQITLKDAYTSLVNNPGMIEKAMGTIQLAPGISITDLQSVTCNTSRYAQEFIYTYESLPVVNQIIGANNQKEMVCAFTEPSDNGVYNVLFIVGAKQGPFVAAYGQTSADGIEAIRNSDVSLAGDNLIMAVSPTIDIVQFICMDIND